MTKMKTKLGLLVALATLLAGGAGVVAATPELEDEYRTSAEVRINLPEGVEPVVVVAPGSGHVRLELPRGSQFPLDFASSTGGLIREGKVIELDNDRLELDLDLALGLLDRVTYEPGAVVLRFESRYEVRGFVQDNEEQYRLGPDDEILLTVHGHPDLGANLTISREGYITAPLVGDVEAEGLTRTQLASRIAELLGRDYIVDPQVDVIVEDFQSQWVMVAGEIRIPGRVPLKGGTRLKEVLSEAGGFGEEAGEVITITRKIPGSTDDATMDIDRADFEDGTLNPVLQNGDIVTVGKARYAYLQGEVGSPGRVRIERGMTLLRALSQSGGLTDWANKKKIQILAEGGGKPVVYNLKDIQQGRVDDPVLFGGEVIVVKRRFF
jgi:polysaccharide export outer membrane protein